MPEPSPPEVPATCAGRGWLVFAVLMLSSLGCRGARTIRDPEFTDLAVAPVVTTSSPQAIASATLPVEASLAGPLPVDEYVTYALSQNPEIQVKRKRVEAAALRVPQAASLQDPMLDVTGYPFYPFVPQYTGGRGTYEVMASQQVPWFGKLRTRVCAAEAEVDEARAELAVAELDVLEQVKRAYYEL